MAALPTALKGSPFPKVLICSWDVRKCKLNRIIFFKIKFSARALICMFLCVKRWRTCCDLQHNATWWGDWRPQQSLATTLIHAVVWAWYFAYKNWSKPVLSSSNLRKAVLWLCESWGKHQSELGCLYRRTSCARALTWKRTTVKKNLILKAVKWPENDCQLRVADHWRR